MTMWTNTVYFTNTKDLQYKKKENKNIHCKLINNKKHLVILTFCSFSAEI